jgi:hypothetical protein
MTTFSIKLRKLREGEYAVFGPKGNQISNIFRGNKFDAIEWSRIWISGWYNWSIDLSEIEDEEKNRISGQTVRPS